MLAAHVLARVASALGLETYMEVTVESDGHLALSDFDVNVHAGVLLDGVGDAMTLHHNREALQGRLKEGRGGRSKTMLYAYPFNLCRRAVVVTMDTSASNLVFFDSHPWLCDERNVITLRLTERAFV